MAWWLLSVFVSMLLLSGLHRHEAVVSAAADCMECAHHVHHSGHFTSAVDHVDDCLLCQFLHFVYTAAAVTLLVPLVILAQHRRFFLNSRMTERMPSVQNTRGPPFVG